tara:strand:- start:2 stop:529 length:528 start_codon:yes stop_codon:yes gene_type:complete
MANLKDCPKFKVHNDYYTPEYAWSNIKHIIPKDKTIWESCMLNSHKSKSPEYLENLGNKVVYDCKMDMLKQQPTDYDIIITNPPFETKIKQDILKRLVELDKPFIIIMNSMNIYSNYIRDIFKDNMKHLQVVNPKGKIHFEKLLEDGQLLYKPNTSFYCIYLCYKMNIPNQDLWL